MHFIRYIGLFLCIPLLAQVSQEGRFSSDYIRGCAPLTIQLTEHDPFGAIDRQYFYETPSNLNVTTSLTHTYTQPGTYQIVQLVGIDVVPKTDTLTIEVFAPTAPVYSYYYCDNRQVQVHIEDPTYDAYEVEFAETTTVTLLDGQQATYSFGMTDPLSIKVKGLYTGAPENCAESTLILPEVKDDLQPPAPTLTELTQPCENVYQLNIQAPFEEDVIYEIEWSKSGGTYTSLFEGLHTGEIVFKNVGFSASETGYCIRINALNVCDGTRMMGSSVCTSLEPGQLAPIRNLYSTYSGESIVLVLEPAAVGQFVFERSYNQTDYSQIHAGSSSYTDTSPFFGRQYFYKVSFDDRCDALWGTQDTSPPFIRATVLSENSYQISFDPAVHASAHAFTYEGRLEAADGVQVFPITTNSFELTLSVSGGKRQTFKIVGTSDNVEVQSNTLKLTYTFVVHVPKAFTPNGDGKNDRLEFFGLGGASAELKIYNRWGQKIYSERSGAPAWDGRIDGHLAPEGVYIYEISVPDQPNHVQKGTFALIKK